ncbi:MAG: non-ribosomal peptide synthetase component F [Parasphingorhabdus sp.]
MFGLDTVERFVTQMKVLLGNMVIAPNKPTALLSIMTDKERNTILYDWNMTEAPWPKEKCIHELFEAQAGVVPSHIALISGENRITYAELFIEVSRVASLLASVGVTTNTPVALLLERSIETVVAIYAVLRAGGVLCASRLTLAR